MTFTIFKWFLLGCPRTATATSCYCVSNKREWAVELEVVLSVPDETIWSSFLDIENLEGCWINLRGEWWREWQRKIPEGGVSQFGEQEWEMRVQGRRNLHKDSRPGWEATKSSGCRAWGGNAERERGTILQKLVDGRSWTASQALFEHLLRPTGRHWRLPSSRVEDRACLSNPEKLYFKPKRATEEQGGAKARPKRALPR